MGAHVGCAGDTAHAHDDAGVLDVFVRVQETGAADADIFALYVADHFIDGIRVDLLDVVVQEEQVLAMRELNAVVVDRRVVERTIPLHDLHIWEALRKCFVVRPGFCLIRVVLDDDELEVFIVSGTQ